MKKNKTFDYSQLMAHIFKIYKILGFWRPDPDMKHKNLYHCYTAFWLSLSITFMSSQVIYMYNNRKSLKEVLAALYITLTFVSILARQLTTYKAMNELKEIIKQLNRPLFQVKCQKHYEIAEETNRNQRLLYNICLFLGVSTDIFAALFPLFSKEKVILAKAWFPYDWTKPFNYFMTYIFQNAVLIWHTFVCYSIDIFTFILLVQIGIQCDILCYTLNHLDDFYFKDGILHEISLRDKLELRKDMEKFSKAMVKNLVVCVQHHREIIKLAKDIQRIKEIGIFVLFASGALVLCTCLFQLSMVQFGSVESMMLLFFSICMLTEQFLYCWFGSDVIYKGSLILQAAYNTPWTDCNSKFRKILLQLTTQACCPLNILAGGLFIMSVPVFISVLQTSYSYLTLLHSIQ